MENMNKKQLEEAAIEIVRFEEQDVVVASTCCSNCNLVGGCVSVCQGNCVGNNG